MSATRTSAPAGIKVICVLATLGAGLGLLGGFAVLALGGVGVVLGPLVIALSFAQLAAVYGLWTLQSWGWTLAIALYSLDVLLDAAPFVLGDGGVADVFGLLLSALILAYVYSKRDHYRTSERTVPEANRV